MPRPVFPVVRLPYDQPDQVARVLDTVRREFKACAGRLQLSTTNAYPAAVALRSVTNDRRCTMTAVQQQSCRPTESDEKTIVDQTVNLDQVTVGVRECTLTPKARPEILVSGGGCGVSSAHHHHKHLSTSSDGGSPYLLVPPVNITAEISRPPQYTAS